MGHDKSFGLYLYKKNQQNQHSLKDLMQLLKTTAPAKQQSFSYIEAKTSLHPHLSLWENLQLEIGHDNWKEFNANLKPEWQSLVKLIKNPERLTLEAETWEHFLVSLIKGISIQSQNLLIDINEELFSPFLIQQFKKSILEATKQKTVFLATANTSLWLDCAHTLVNRNEFVFESQTLNVDQIKKHWAA